MFDCVYKYIEASVINLLSISIFSIKKYTFDFKFYLERYRYIIVLCTFFNVGKINFPNR